MKTQTTHQDVYVFWFGDNLKDNYMFPIEHSRLWFDSDEADDALIRDRFGSDVENALKGGFPEWRETPRGFLALTILLDQMTRNIFRGSARAFTGDQRACLLASEALKRKIDQELLFLERWFLYMPFMHSENLDVQKLSVTLFKELSLQAPMEIRIPLEQAYDYAVRHFQVIERFGRFPHRNKLLGRPSTAQEIDFLKLPGSSF